MVNYHLSATAAVLLSSLAVGTGFQQPLPRTLSPTLTTSSTNGRVAPTSFTSSSSLYFWGNKDKDNNNEEKDDDDEKDKAANADKNKEGGGFLGNLLPFFANSKSDDETTPPQKSKDDLVKTEAAAASATATPEDIKPAAPVRPRGPVVIEEVDPVKRAGLLRAQAERARLEAEKMDAELTLAKISKLEKDMAKAVKKGETTEALQTQMDRLQAKLRGEEPPAPVAVAAVASTTTSSSSSSSDKKDENSFATISMDASKDGGMMKINLGDFSDKTVEGLVDTFEKSPRFMQKMFAQMAEIDFDTVDGINATEVAVRMLQMQQMDFSYSGRPKPVFTQQDIDKAMKEDTAPWIDSLDIDSSLKESVRNNSTAKALLSLEYNYYVTDMFADGQQMEKLLEGQDWLKDLVESVNTTKTDAAIEMLYPKCTRKEDAVLPTMAQVTMLCADVLPKAAFTPRGKPEEVLGGFIIRGTSKKETGDETMEAIEKELAKNPNLADKMTVLLAKDFTLLAEADTTFNDLPNPDDEPPILLIMGPDIVTDRKRIPLAITTAFGIATSWYLSVYPFLLNPAILKRTEEQLELADSSMQYDLSWLTTLSLPLFLTFIGIQLAHEAGHKLGGAASGTETSFPTFVPSLITGVTSSVTQFKEPPKNKEAMFDVSIAGPLLGSVASLAALVVGSQLTLTSDPSLLPALPLAILRQSTLGGGIIDAILGSGALSVPYGAEASQAVAGMTVSLHPVAVAGYIGLILNGLALLPIGTTDGGRIALAMFGRGGKGFIGNLFISTVFLVGILGSDLFLFYFSFLIAFQTGNEIPAKNEVDDIGFERIILATASSVLALLILIPIS